MENEVAEEQKRNIFLEEDLEDFAKKGMENLPGANINLQISFGDIIANCNGVVVGDNAQIEDVRFLDKTGKASKEKRTKGTFGFQSVAELADWVTMYFKKYELALMITTAVFHDMPYIWINTYSKALYEKWKIHMEVEEGAEIVAKDILLNEIGAMTYTGYIITNGGKTETEFIAFEDEAVPEMVLKYIWNQYLDFREILIEWIKLYALKANVSQAYAAVEAIAIWAQEDFGYFESRILNGLITEESFVTVAELMSIIGRNPAFQLNIQKKALHWGTLQSIQYPMLALVIAQKGKWEVCEISKLAERYFENVVQELERGQEGDYIDWLPLMYLVGGRNANYHKAIVDALHHMASKQAGKYPSGKKACLNFIFYMLVQSDMEQSHIESRKVKEMIMVRMLFIKNQYSDYLCRLWEDTWSNRRLQRLLKKMMRRYWLELLNVDESYRKEMQAFYHKIHAAYEAESILKYRG